MSKAHRSLRWSSSIAVIALFAAATLSSCTSPGAFRNVPRKQPHAELITGWIDYSIFTPRYESLVHTINGQPVDRPDRRKRYRIPPGATVIQPGMEDWSAQYDPMHFTAVAGRTYILRLQIKSSGLQLSECPPSPGKSSKSQIVARSKATYPAKPDDRRSKF
jgi:hypothetical protein